MNPKNAKLSCHTGALAGTEIKVTRDILIGRQPSCDLVLYPHSVSGQHARLYFSSDDGHYYIEDLGSSNGTWGTILPDNTSRFFSTSVVYNPNPFPTSCPVYPPYVYAKMEKPFSRPRQEIKPSGTPRVFADEAYEELHRGRDDGEVDLLNQELLAIQQGEASSDNETN